jgi:hypothetical protein
MIINFGCGAFYSWFQVRWPLSWQSIHITAKEMHFYLRLVKNRQVDITKSSIRTVVLDCPQLLQAILAAWQGVVGYFVLINELLKELSW